MNELLLKEQLQSTIMQSMEHLSQETVYGTLKIYKNYFGADDFFNQCALTISQQGPLVSLICLNCSDNYIDEILSRQLYSNLEVVRVESDDSFMDIFQYIVTTQSKYLCFCEPNHRYDSARIFDMVSFFEQLSSIDMLIVPRSFIDASGTVIAAGELPYSEAGADFTMNGMLLLQNSINTNRNMYGNLSTLMVNTQYAKSISYDFPENDIPVNAMNTLSFLFQLLAGGKISYPYIYPHLVSTILQPYEDNTLLQKTYEEFVTSFAAKNAFVFSPMQKKSSSSYLLPKEITFFYTDRGEHYNLEPVAAEAAKRGYKVEFTQNTCKKAEIGIYCQHECHPENSKFSVILLHDLAQRHDLWPNIWASEPWDKFDLGIVPGKFWSSLWSQCACLPYANPRCGTYELGYPKSDLIDSFSLKHRAETLRSKLNLKYNFSILYAPSWENDGKEDDFVRALSSLKVNLLIKQAHLPVQYGHIIENIKQMRLLHENKYDNLYYIEPEESILTALALCDIVVSDESNVMSEALLFHKPSIAVIDWLIPDTTPSRPACVPMDYVIKCKKADLKECAEKLFSAPTHYNSILKRGNTVCSNQGHVCNDIMDAIEYFTGHNTENSFLAKKVFSKYTPCSMWN